MGLYGSVQDPNGCREVAIPELGGVGLWPSVPPARWGSLMIDTTLFKQRLV